LVKQNHKTLY